MKKVILLTRVAMLVVLMFFSAAPIAFGQNGVRIAATSGAADASSMLDVASTTKGVLIPRMLASERTSIASPAAGLLVYQTDGTPGFYYNAGSPGTPNWVILSAGQLSGVGAVNYITKWTAFSPNGVLGNSLIYDNGSNVGIGTITPGAPLTIAHEASYTFPNPGSAAKGALNIRMATSNRETGITFSQSATDNAQAGIYVHQDNSAGTHMYFATTNSYAVGPQVWMTILNSGNVGIGTVTPAAKLDVVGDIKVSGRLYGTGIASYAVARTQSQFTPPTSMSAANGSGNEIPGLSVTIITHGGDLEIEGTLFMQWNNVNARGEFSASIDGVWVGSNLGWGSSWALWYDGIIGMYGNQANWDTRTYHRVVPGVAAGTHTVKLLAWNETASGWYINCCSMVSELVVTEKLKQN